MWLQTLSQKEVIILFQIKGRERELELNFIRENWQRMNDKEMAEHLQCSEIKVGLRRLKLGLKRRRGGGGKTRENGLKSKVSRQWLEKALNKDGQTEQGIAKMFGVSRQRVCQLCQEWGIAINRTPEWYANFYGKPELADKEWLEEQLKKPKSIRFLSREMKVSPATIKSQIERLKIDPVLITRWPAKRVKIICDFCGSEIVKLKSWIREGQKHHFCNRTCKGRWLGTNFGGMKSTWTEEEDDFIRANYFSMTDAKMAEHLGRSYAAVMNRRLRKLGLKKRGLKRMR